MKIFKLILTLLILGFAALFAWENLSTFQSTLRFQLNLYIREPQTWELYIYTVLGIAFSLGFFLGILLVLRPYLRMRRRLQQERLEKDQLRTAQESAKAAKQAPPVSEGHAGPPIVDVAASADPKSDTAATEEAPPVKTTQE